MAVTPDRRSRLAPWAGLATGMLAAGGQHQGMSNALHFGCGVGQSTDLMVGISALLLIVIGTCISWRALASSEATSARRFVARLSLMAAGLFALMVVWQTLAGFIEPACRP
ncbi:MAG TPA: hypothetical protein VGH81_01200 [Rudaea sp.]|jgi:hypothetical protein